MCLVKAEHVDQSVEEGLHCAIEFLIDAGHIVPSLSDVGYSINLPRFAVLIHARSNYPTL